jgi:hypothetical protein
MLPWQRVLSPRRVRPAVSRRTSVDRISERFRRTSVHGRRRRSRSGVSERIWRTGGLCIVYYRDQQHWRELIGDLSYALRAAASPLEVVLPSETIEINQVVPGTRIQQGLIFWCDLNGRVVADMYQAKAYMVWDALTGRRMNGAVIMVGWEYPAGGDFDASQVKTIGFMRELVPLLRQHMPS